MTAVETTMQDRLRPAVFLDRDGVILRADVEAGTPRPAANAQAAELLPDVGEALRRLRGAGFLLLVVTNQPDVARGKQSRQYVEETHRKLQSELPLDEVYVCYHDDADGCSCRKPKPGMILQGAVEHGVDLRRSYLVGDRWRDIDAGAAAGCRTLLIDYAYAERAPQNKPHAVVRSLLEASDWILSHSAASAVQSLQKAG